MKKIIFLVFFGLFLCSPLFSQIERGMWQMQNPPQWTFNSIMTFRGGRVTNTMCNMTNPSDIRRAVGTYKLTGSTLVIAMNGVRYVYTLKWYGRNKIALCCSQATLIYSQSNTPDDTYMQNYLAWSSVYGAPSTPAPAQRVLCYTCRGSGSCRICHGSGRASNPYTGTSSICTGCNGTGKCWRCHGGGYE
jgi:hypothetical protein